jgi:parallel beta-helix repeat protein
VTNVWRNSAGVTVENCRRCTISNCSILDCDGAGLLLKNSELCRVSDCLIREDREGRESASLIVEGGRGNQVTKNLLSVAARVSEGAAVLSDNTVVAGRVQER